ncbi:toprim domain-containing protein [Riemerella anatipestifer]|uniref:toprim domain-containing protein n=1 Tax=Riemerella anatipestifer TaxID=34085 RepID=UPI002EBAF88C|nr:toprim domain-containing protein [Riemerella anatipestifer]
MKYTSEEIKNITDNASVLDYFLYLEKAGRVKFERKTGHDYYFRTDANKFSVSEKRWYDYKNQIGGGIVKAVMSLEYKSWKETIDFLKDFNNIQLDRDLAERKAKWKKQGEQKADIELKKTLKPNNGNLIDYFAERGIERDILEKYTEQVHYKINDKYYFGIGIKNEAGGYEIRNPYLKSKIGANDISITKGEKGDELMVFEGMTDMLSFIQMQKNKGLETKRTLVILNSVTNTNKFLERYKDFSGKVFLALDRDDAGDLSTKQIIDGLANANTKDIRQILGLEYKQDLNDFLLKTFDIHKNKTKLAEVNKTQNEHEKSTQPTGIPASESVGNKQIEPNHREFDQTSQSKQRSDNGGRQNMVNNDVGNGFDTSERSDLGRTGRGQDTGTPANSQPKNDEIPKLVQEEKSRQTGDSLEFREGTDGRQSRNENSIIGKNDTTHYRDNSGRSVLPHRTDANLRGGLTNEQITELINSVTEISDRKEVLLKGEIPISVKDAASQYKSGGITKDGRGILDEYYTAHEIVDVVRNLIKDNFKGKTEISVLEPSVGTGNFLHATKDLGVKTNITAFEINETTAKIAKILYPKANINFRSFESEFITDDGQKKSPVAKYDLVIGNPPYGQHRGFYKGLGEESKISRYEDYFVKRSLDVLKDGGVLAMVLPSGWLNRQKDSKGTLLMDAYRLPNGVFKGTDIGTDIIILKKDSFQENIDFSNYFNENPEKILGEITTKTNQWAKEVEYVKGSLDSALEIIQSFIQQNEKQKQKQAEQVKEIKEVIGDLWGEWTQEEQKEVQKEKSVALSEEQPKKEQTEWDIELEKAKKNLTKALEGLEGMKFKSSAVKNKIIHYRDLRADLHNKSKDFTLDDLKDISEKTEKTIKLKNNIAYSSEYLVQNKPEIKKGVLKYQFQKQDEIVDTKNQGKFNHLSDEEIELFRQTDYDGSLPYNHEYKEYINYVGGKWVHNFYYAEGDIYEKLAQLESLYQKGKLDNDEYENERQYRKQKELLESVLPKKKGLDDIIISPNHEFVHQFSLGQVEKEKNWRNPLTKQWEYEKLTVDYSLADKFQDFVRNLPNEAFGQSNSWEVNSFVRNETVTGSDRDRNAEVRERRKEVANDLFYKFVREELDDELKERFVNEFNRKYNNIHIPNYKEFPLFSKIHKNFKGNPLRLTEVQKGGVGRLTTKGVGLLAHEVGFGKTLSGVLAMHEAMERGNAKRPLIVVPNDSILKQWVETIFETIPNAKVNVLGNLGKNYDLSRFDNRDGEITLVTYEGFNNIGFSENVTNRLASRFTYISRSETKYLKNTVGKNTDLDKIDPWRFLENSKTEREQQIEIKKREEIQGKIKKGKIYDWEDFGFDHLTFDEVHNANHIIGKVRIEDRRFASDFRNQSQVTSLLGINTWVASQYIQEQNDGRNVVLLSATPFTNKPLEYYSILSLIANKRLEKSGYFNVNTFFETFMEADNEMEIDAKGDIKYKMNVRRFKNNALFQQLLGEFIDIKGEEDNPELKRPNRINKEYKIEQNSLTEKEYSNLNASFDESADGAILTHILNARLIALSPYLSKFYEGQKPTMEEFVENSPKLKTTIDLMAQNKKDKPEAGQIIYSELGISEFPKIKEYLIAKVGYKPNEVEMITGATSKNKRLEIQEKFNQGKIKIILGSEAIQEGMNLQQNTTDMYLLTLPYNFTSLRQIEGRAWRQGNKWENVRINFMLTNDSIEVFMLQKLQTKQSRYMEAMKKGANIIDVSDVDTQELKTAIITDPELRAKIEIEVVKKKFESQKNRQSSELGYISRKFEKYTKSEEFKKVQRLKYDIKEYTEWAKDDGDWADKLESTKVNLTNAEENLKELIDTLAKQGVNVKDFEEQKRMTEEKIAELDRLIQEELPKMEQELIKKYKEEKAEQLRKTSPLNFVEERAEENKTFFKLVHTEKTEKVNTFKR